MNTIILKWNPTLSDYKNEQFSADVQTLNEGGSFDLTWSLNKEHRVCYGDRFFVVREGKGNNGIVMAGYFCSDAYSDGSDSYVADIDVMVMVNIDDAPFVSINDLQKTVKDVDWAGCPTGTLVDDHQAALLEQLWLQYLYDHQDCFGDYRAAESWDFDLEDFESVPPTLQTYLKERYGCKCERCHRDESEVTEMAYHIILDDYDPEHPAPLTHHLRCLCSDCWFGEDAD